MSVPIADLAALLMSHGLSADVVRQSLELAEAHAAKAMEDRPSIVRQSADVVRASADSAADRRKEYDRNRQAEIRRLKRLSEKPPLILTSSSLLSEEPLSEERKKESSGIRARARKKLGPLPESWQPPDNAHALAAEHGTTVNAVEPVFRDYLKSSGKLYADHDAAFCNFVRNQQKFNRNGNGGDAKPRYGIIQAADSLRRKVASFDGPVREDIDIRDGAGPAAPRLLSQR